MSEMSSLTQVTMMSSSSSSSSSTSECYKQQMGQRFIQAKESKVRQVFGLLAVSSFVLLLLIGTSFSSQMCQATRTAPINGERIRESLKSVDNCTLHSVYSFIYPSAAPPVSLDTMRKSCRVQADAIKCVREQSRRTMPILRRGLGAFVQNRQRHHRKYCSNINGEPAKKFFTALKCVMEKRLANFTAIDAEFANSVQEIYNRNYDDSAIELKYLCCSIINYRRSIIEGSGAECAASKQIVEEMIMSIVSNDISLICEDEDKLTSKVCPSLQPMNLPKGFNADQEMSTSSTILYLIATLGEPEARVASQLSPIETRSSSRS